MLAKRTIIGFIVGSAIIGIGVYSLITGFGFQTIDVDETFEIGESTSYQISANKGALQQMKITGEKFDLEVRGFDAKRDLIVNIEEAKNEA